MEAQIPNSILKRQQKDKQTSAAIVDQYSSDDVFQGNPVAPLTQASVEVPRSMITPWLDPPEVNNAIFGTNEVQNETPNIPQDPNPQRVWRGGKRRADSKEILEPPQAVKRGRNLDVTLAPSPILSPDFVPINPTLKKEDITLDSDFTLPSPELRALLNEMSYIDPANADPTDAQFPLLSPVLRPLLSPLRLSPVHDPAEISQQELMDAFDEMERSQDEVAVAAAANNEDVQSIDDANGKTPVGTTNGALDNHAIKEEDHVAENIVKKEGKKRKYGPRKPRAKKQAAKPMTPEKFTSEESAALDKDTADALEASTNQAVENDNQKAEGVDQPAEIVVTPVQQMTQEPRDSTQSVTQEYGTMDNQNHGNESMNDVQQPQWMKSAMQIQGFGGLNQTATPDHGPNEVKLHWWDEVFSSPTDAAGNDESAQGANAGQEPRTGAAGNAGQTQWGQESQIRAAENMPQQDGHVLGGNVQGVPHGTPDHANHRALANVHTPPFRIGHSGRATSYIQQEQFYFQQPAYPPAPMPMAQYMHQAPVTPVHGANMSPPAYTPSQGTPYANGGTPINYYPPFHQPPPGPNHGPSPNGHQQHNMGYEEAVPRYLPIQHHQQQQQYVPFPPHMDPRIQSPPSQITYHQPAPPPQQSDMCYPFFHPAPAEHAGQHPWPQHPLQGHPQQQAQLQWY